MISVGLLGRGLLRFSMVELGGLAQVICSLVVWVTFLFWRWVESLKQVVGIYEITKSVAEAPVVQLKIASLYFRILHYFSWEFHRPSSKPPIWLEWKSPEFFKGNSGFCMVILLFRFLVPLKKPPNQGGLGWRCVGGKNASAVAVHEGWSGHRGGGCWRS